MEWQWGKRESLSLRKPAGPETEESVQSPRDTSFSCKLSWPAKQKETPLPFISYSTSLQLLKRQPCPCRPEDICQSNVKKELIMVTIILTTIWWSELLRKGELFCFLTFLLPQENLHFRIVHDRVTISVEPVLAHSPSSSSLHIRPLLSGPLGLRFLNTPLRRRARSQVGQWLVPSCSPCLGGLCLAIALVAFLFLSPPLLYQHSLLLSSPRSLDGSNLISSSASLQEIFTGARDALPGLW